MKQNEKENKIRQSVRDVWPKFSDWLNKFIMGDDGFEIIREKHMGLDGHYHYSKLVWTDRCGILVSVEILPRMLSCTQEEV